MKTKKAICVLCAVMMALSLMSCAKTVDAPASNAPDHLTFGWSVYDLANPFFIPMDKGVKDKAAELGITLLPTHDNKSDATEMVTGVTALINQGIDALVISPFSPESLGTVKALADEAGIPVIVVDIGTGGTQVDAFIMSDMRGGGKLAGQYFVDLMNSGEYPDVKSANVAIIKCETSATYAITRGEGFKDAVVPVGFNVVEEQHGNSSKDEAYAIMLDYIAKYSNDLAAVFCENDQMALGAAAAIDENGLTGKILVFGFDGNEDAVDAIKEGSMHGTAAQNPHGMGSLGVELAFRVVNGETLTSGSKEDGTGNLIFWSPMNMIGNKGVQVTPTGTGAAPVVAEGLTFGWSVYDLANPFFIPMDQGVKDKAAELGIALLPTHDNKSDATEMITGVTALIAQGIDALVISPFSPESLGTVKALADEAGIPVVVVDIGTGGTLVDAFIMSDMRGGGALAGQYFVDLMKGGEYAGITSVNVAIIKCETSATYAITRGEGFKDAAVPAGFNVVEEQHGNSSKDEAYAIMLDYIAKYGNDLAAVFCENDQMALGAAAAIDENGLTGKILVFGFDGNEDAVDAIKEGSMHGTAAQNPYGMGQLGVELAARLVGGETLSSSSQEAGTGNLIFWSPMAMIGNKGEILG